MTATATATRPAFRAAWTHGAKGYDEADTFAAALDGFKRRRKAVIFHMPNTGVAGLEACAYCGGLLNEPARAASQDHGNGVRSESSASDKVDTWSTWTYHPGVKKISGGLHYVCSWSHALGALHAQYRDVA